MNVFQNRLKNLQLLLIITVLFSSCTENLGLMGEEAALPETKEVLQSEMLQRINEVRKEGCTCGSQIFPPAPPLIWNAKQTEAADRHALDMANNNFYDHTGTDGTTVGVRAKDAGYAWSLIGENIAMSYPTVEETVNAWLKSSAHCRNIMAPEFLEMGVATQGDYWVQVLGRKGN